MSFRRGAVLFLLFATAFLLANRSAYRGYFQDDEIDNLSWTPYLTALDYLKGFATPLYQPNNFRPAGHFYFAAVERGAGLWFPAYVAVVHALHLLNVWLLWWVVRRLGASPLAAASACAFFGFHMALFDNFWKPMYVFDVLCATWSLAALALWMRGRWILSFLAFWLAYKSKELAVMLPLVLALYELWFGRRRWKPLIPFLAASLSFGLQSMLLNPNRDNAYTFRFTLEALSRTAPFYAGRLFLVPYLGFAIPLFAILARNRRTWFGLAMLGLFFFPMLFLPGRIFSAYCYLPLTGLAIALTGVAEATSPAVLAALALLMLPLDYRELRRNGRETLARDAGIRTWMRGVERFAAANPAARAFVYSGTPAGFQSWGVEGALKYFYERGDLTIRAASDADAAALRSSQRVALLWWDPVRARLDIVY
jgi:hypothetical protein